MTCISVKNILHSFDMLLIVPFLVFYKYELKLKTCRKKRTF